MTLKEALDATGYGFDDLIDDRLQDYQFYCEDLAASDTVWVSIPGTSDEYEVKVGKVRAAMRRIEAI